MTLNQLLQRVFIGIWCVLIIFILIFYGNTLDGIREGASGDRLGRDFINFWTGGTSFWDSNAPSLYNLDEYRSYIVSLFGEPLSKYSFSYPPHAILLLSVFGALPYVPALMAWSMGGVFAVVKALKSFDIEVSKFWLVFTPAVIICLLSGQTGLWIAALFFGGMMLSPKRPVLAGVLIGLLTIKPQFGPLLVLGLLLSGQWKTIISASVTTIVLALLSVAVFGWNAWTAFIGETLPYQAEIISHDYGVFDYMVPSPFKWMINMDASIAMAWALQGVWMFISVVGTFFLFKSKETWAFKIAGLGVLTFLFSPYVAVYDMALLLPAAFLVLRINPLLGLMILSLPVLGLIAAIYNIPLSQVSILILALYFILKPETLRAPQAAAAV